MTDKPKTRTVEQWAELIYGHGVAITLDTALSITRLIFSQGRREGTEATMGKYGLNLIAETCDD